MLNENDARQVSALDATNWEEAVFMYNLAICEVVAAPDFGAGESAQPCWR